MPARRIVFITGARSEYDLLFPVIRACRERAGLHALVIAGAGHLSPLHGQGIELIRADAVEIAGTVELLLAADSWSARSLSFAHFYAGVTGVLANAGADVIVVAGDREEALAGALAGNFLQIPVAHLFGGDRCIASDIDEVFRPAISKLAHLHFTATEGHRQRLIRMGEQPARVWAVGATGLDRLAEEPQLTRSELAKELGPNAGGPFLLLIQHPSPTLNKERSGEEMEVILDAMLDVGVPVFCSYPNFDPGSLAMRSALDRAAQRAPQLHLFHNLPRRLFVNLFRHCTVILGNSSSIVIEAGFLKKAAILIGPRQDLREVGSNVVRVGIDRGAIRHACWRAYDDAQFQIAVQQCESLYGDGRSGPRIASILADLELGSDLLMKTIPY